MVFVVVVKKSFLDYIYMQTVKGGAKYGLKYAMFSGIMLGTSLVIQAYRNQTNLYDYSIGGGSIQFCFIKILKFDLLKLSKTNRFQPSLDY